MDAFWTLPLDGIPTGDMPGDKVVITESHRAKARTIAPRLVELLDPLLANSPHHRAVVSVHGGSGVGKSEIGSLLAAYLNARGTRSYVLSGDNYPHRIPQANDAERLRVYREAGEAALTNGTDQDGVRAELATLQQRGADSDPAATAGHPWLAAYQEAGRRALAGYLGSPDEIDFEQLNAIIAAFHAGAPTLHLKRMGRTADQRWHEDVDARDLAVLVIEWTHGNNANLRGVDLPILLTSTPEETLAHRRSRARDGAVDSPFTSTVLDLEQRLLHSQAEWAAIIVSKAGTLLDHDAYLAANGPRRPGAGPMLNVYPDSIGGTLADLVEFVRLPELAGVFESAYLLPSVFNTDLDRGFSVIDYGLSERYASAADLAALAAAGLDFKFDFILNHASVLSPQFQDLLARGDDSPYADFFIDWNAFWAGHGELTEAGYIQPDPALIRDMFFRKPGLPILMVRMPDGTDRPYWNTFYQEVRYPRPDAQDLMRALGVQYATADLLAARISAALDAGRRPAEIDFAGVERHRDAVVDLLEGQRKYLGQMDLNIASPRVWEFYADTLRTLAGYGAGIVRLDAFAYAPKEPGAKNFLNDPGTWDLLERVRQLAETHGVRLLPEIHSRYEERIHEVIADKGFMTYDFFLPGLLIHALARRDATVVKAWIGDVLAKKIRTVTMLGCHDGIPLLDLKGLLSDDEIDEVIQTVKSRGGYVKDLHGEKKLYYQVNATYFSALGESEAALLLARAIQLFIPGKPQVWYLDLFAGRNDHAAVARAGEGGHKEINRSNLSLDDVRAGLATEVVARQLELLRFRNQCPAFGFDADCEVADTEASRLRITWRHGGHTAVLDADLAALSVSIEATDPEGAVTFRFAS